MSGGEYDYAYQKIDELAEAIRVEGEGHCSPPKIREEFRAHLRKVAEACRAIELNDSGDGHDSEVALVLACLPPVLSSCNRCGKPYDARAWICRLSKEDLAEFEEGVLAAVDADSYYLCDPCAAELTEEAKRLMENG